MRLARTAVAVEPWALGAISDSPPNTMGDAGAAKTRAGEAPSAATAAAAADAAAVPPPRKLRRPREVRPLPPSLRVESLQNVPLEDLDAFGRVRMNHGALRGAC